MRIVLGKLCGTSLGGVLPLRSSRFPRPLGVTTTSDANRRPSVFISHSGDEGVVAAVLDQLVIGLKEAGFEPLLDRMIGAGANFHHDVGRWVDACDAAVIVVSPRALEPERAWVLAEVNQLQYKVRTPGFQTIPVLLGGVVPKDLRRPAWEPTGLALCNLVVSDNPALVVARVVAELAATRDRVTASPTARALERYLRRITNEDTLRAAAEELGIPALPSPVARHLAVRLMRAGPGEVLTAAKVLNFENTVVARVTLALALPFAWVDREAAVALAVALRGHRVAALNAIEKYTLDCYVTCGVEEDPPWSVELYESLQGEYLAEVVEDAIAEQEWQDGKLEEAEPERWARPAPVSPTVYALRCGPLTPELLDFVEDWFGGVRHAHVVLLAGGQRWADVPRATADRVVLVTPELDAALEEDATSFYRESLEMLTKLGASEAAFLSEIGL